MGTLNMSRFLQPATRGDVDAERDRRNVLDFEFEGHFYQADSISRQKFDRAKSSALAAKLRGKGEPGDYFWTVEGEMFIWIDRPNKFVPMDADTIILLVDLLDQREGVLTKAGNMLKARIDKGEKIVDLSDPALWVA